MTIVLVALLLQVVFGQPADGVSVSTDMSVYAQGDPVQVTMQICVVGSGSSAQTAYSDPFDVSAPADAGDGAEPD